MYNSWSPIRKTKTTQDVSSREGFRVDDTHVERLKEQGRGLK